CRDCRQAQAAFTPRRTHQRCCSVVSALADHSYAALSDGLTFAPSPSLRRGAAPSTRLGGRSAHDASARLHNTTGATISLARPRTACDAAAALSSKTIPAYAHSLRRSTPGTTNVIAPGIFQSPRIVSTYTG